MDVPVLKMDEAAYHRQIEDLRSLRRERDSREAVRTLRGLEHACRDGTNVMPALIEAVKAHTTLGEMCGTMRDVFGGYQETAYL